MHGVRAGLHPFIVAMYTLYPQLVDPQCERAWSHLCGFRGYFSATDTVDAQLVRAGLHQFIDAIFSAGNLTNPRTNLNFFLFFFTLKPRAE